MPNHSIYLFLFCFVTRPTPQTFWYWKRNAANVKKRPSDHFNAVIKKFEEQEEATLRALVVKSRSQSVIRLVDGYAKDGKVDVEDAVTRTTPSSRDTASTPIGSSRVLLPFGWFAHDRFDPPGSLPAPCFRAGRERERGEECVRGPSTVRREKILETHFVAARQRVRASYRAPFFIPPNTFCFCFVFSDHFVCTAVLTGLLSPLHCADKATAAAAC